MTDSANQSGISERWQAWRNRLPLADYEARFQTLEAEGNNIHGEVDALDRLRSASTWTSQGRTATVLDAGCGTGRAAVELNKRGWSVTAVDYDPDMVELAQAKSPEVAWHCGSLVDIDLGQTFDAILMAGNILLFAHEGSEPAILANLARHLSGGGLLIAGFQLSEFSLDTYEQWCSDAGLEPVQQWATWDGDGFAPTAIADANYVVAVHQLSDESTNGR